MGQLVFDYFNRVNAATLGANWTNTTTAFTITGGQACVSAGIAAAVYSAWSGSNDHYSEAIPSFKGSSTDMSAAVRGAISGGNFTAYTFEINDTDANSPLGTSMSCGLYKDVSNVFTQLGSSAFLIVNAGDTIRVEVSGTTVIAKLNSIPVFGPNTDAGIASGKPGISCGGITATSTPFVAIQSFAAGNFYGTGNIEKSRFPFASPNGFGPFAPRRARLRRFAYAPQAYILSGTTLDSNGNIVGSVTVKLYTTVDDIERASTISDAVTGAYSFRVGSGAQFYCVGYLAGSPDRAGTTVNTLTEAGA